MNDVSRILCWTLKARYGCFIIATWSLIYCIYQLRSISLEMMKTNQERTVGISVYKAALKFQGLTEDRNPFLLNPTVQKLTLLMGVDGLILLNCLFLIVASILVITSLMEGSRLQLVWPWFAGTVQNIICSCAHFTLLLSLYGLQNAWTFWILNSIMDICALFINMYAMVYIYKHYKRSTAIEAFAYAMTPNISGYRTPRLLVSQRSHTPSMTSQFLHLQNIPMP